MTSERQMERMKLLFIHRLAQRVMTPLTMLTATQSLLAERVGQPGDPRLAELLEETAKNALTCSSQLKNLLDFTSRSFSDHSASFRWGHSKLEDLVSSAAGASKALLEEKGFHVVPLFRPDTVEVEGDREKLQLVFNQLVENAAKFGKPGGKVLIGAEPDAGRLRISFLDDGPGIALSERKGAGRIGYQVEPHNTAEVPCLGVGLWLASEAVHFHHGKLAISSPASEDQTGTLVQLTLPGSFRGEAEGDEETLQLPVSSGASRRVR
jgi:two-component system phosphate regulon sensor histidine kinase PhoR